MHLILEPPIETLNLEASVFLRCVCVCARVCAECESSNFVFAFVKVQEEGECVLRW
jgi:hypothetical protein